MLRPSLVIALSVAGVSVFAGCNFYKDKTAGNVAASLDEPLTFATISNSILQPKCATCHRAGGTGPDLSTYNDVMEYVTRNEPSQSPLYTWVAGQAGELMPQGGPPLPPGQIALIATWISAGAPEFADRPAPVATPTATPTPISTPEPIPTGTPIPTPTPSPKLSWYGRIQTEVLTPLCSACHSGAHPKAHVDLSSYASIMANQELVKPGDVANSLLDQVIQISYEDRMPLNGPPLSADQIQLITGWIAAGASETAPAP